MRSWRSTPRYERTFRFLSSLNFLGRWIRWNPVSSRIRDLSGREIGIRVYEERNICTRYWTVRNSADVPITKWRDISWSAGDARAWSGINPVQDSGTIRRFLARISGRVHAEESRSRARGSIRQRYRRPVNNGREFALEGEPEQLHVRLRASESDAGVLWRK